jgi:hypothetical protein
MKNCWEVRKHLHHLLHYEHGVIREKSLWHVWRFVFSLCTRKTKENVYINIPTKKNQKSYSYRSKTRFQQKLCITLNFKRSCSPVGRKKYCSRQSGRVYSELNILHSNECEWLWVQWLNELCPDNIHDFLNRKAVDFVSTMVIILIVR